MGEGVADDEVEEEVEEDEPDVAAAALLEVVFVLELPTLEELEFEAGLVLVGREAEEGKVTVGGRLGVRDKDDERETPPLGMEELEAMVCVPFAIALVAITRLGFWPGSVTFCRGLPNASHALTISAGGA